MDEIMIAQIIISLWEIAIVNPVLPDWSKMENVFRLLKMRLVLESYQLLEVNIIDTLWMIELNL